MKLLDVQPMVAAIVGNCFPLVAPPEMQPPYAVYLRTSFVDDPCMDGSLADQQQNTIEVTVYAKTYLEAAEKAELVRQAFYKALAVQTAGYDNYDPTTQLFGVTQEFSVYLAYDENGLPKLQGNAETQSSEESNDIYKRQTFWR